MTKKEEKDKREGKKEEIGLSLLSKLETLDDVLFQLELIILSKKERRFN